MKVLYCGDPHARPDCLDDVQALIDYIKAIIIRDSIPYICFLGDLFHSHSVVHSPVMAFWQKAFTTLSEHARVYTLVGNHDMSGRQGDKAHALMLYDSKVVTVVDTLVEAPWGAVLAPYRADPSQLVQEANAAYKPSQRVLVCHQTLSGSRYENGFYAHDGVDPALFKHEHIISGHIHRPQEFDKVWYPGSPRWQIVTDANTSRAVWVVDHARDGTPRSRTAHSTDHICHAIHQLKDTEDAQADPSQLKGTIIVDVFGSEMYIKGRRPALESMGCRVRTFPDAKKGIRVKESDGVATAFTKFAQAYVSKHGTSSEILLEMAQKRMAFLGS